MWCRRWIALVVLAGLAWPAFARADDEEDQLKSDLATLKSGGVDTDAKGLLEFFKKRTLKDDTRKKIETFVAELGADTWTVRAKAQQGLIDIGVLSRPMLVGALASGDPEVVRRARFALRQIGQPSEEAMLLPCAARALANKKPAGAAEAILGVLPCIEDADAADEVALALAAVALDKDKKPLNVVIVALKDRYAIKRHAAGQALARIGGDDNREAARKLLKDPESGVRRRVALALLEGKDKAAVPTLINLLTSASSDDVYAAEDALFTLAGEKAPSSPAAETPKARERYVKDWTDWWKENEAKTDLKKFDFTNAVRNLTLIVVQNNRIGRGVTGTVMEVDANNKQRWKFESQSYPIFATMIRNDRVLMCEANNNKVTERDLKGNVKWEKNANYQVVSAQRLRNGNTFIVSRNQLQEVDKDGKEVRTIARPSYDIIGAHKDQDGKITLVTYNYIIRMDATGKQLSSNALGRYLSMVQGSRMHFLPKGGVIIPDYSYNKIREYDANGKVVWEADAQRVTSVAKLRNGNLLVASRYGNKTWEINYKTKKEVPNSTKTVDGGIPLMAEKR